MSHGALYNVVPVLELLPRDMQSMRILDVGFGYGQFGHVITASCFGKQRTFLGEPYIIGIDIDPQNVSLAKKWMPFYREAYLCDALKIPYPTDMVKDLKIIICSEMVEHTTDKQQTIRMIKYLRDLAPLVIFTCPDGNSLSPKSDGYHTHNTIWHESDFRKLGFETRLVSRLDFGGQELRLITLLVRFINTFRLYNKTIINTIIAWKKDEH